MKNGSVVHGEITHLTEGIAIDARNKERGPAQWAGPSRLISIS
jgi:hypothetical protein